MFKRKVRKAISVLLAAVMFFTVAFSAFGSIDVMAGVEEFIVNGGFEKLNQDGTPSDWTIALGSFGTDYTISNDSPNGGTNAVRISTDKAQVYMLQGVKDMVAGKTYQLTFHTNVIAQAAGANKGFAIKFEFRNHNDNGTTTRVSEADFIRYFTDAAKNEWQEQTIEFTAPANGASILVRWFGSGEAYFDDVSLKGEKPGAEVPPAMNIKDPVPGAVNMIENGGFEVLGASGEPEGWIPFGGTWNEDQGSQVVVAAEGAYEGQNCVKLTAADSSKPWLNYYIRDVVPGAEYQLTAWLNQIQSEIGGGAVIKLEYYSDRDKAPGSNLGQETTVQFAPYYGGWQQVVATFVPPENCKLAIAYLRLYGPGELYWDKAECYMTETPQKFDFETDNFFYYTDWDQGEATVAVNQFYSLPQGGTVDFVLKDDAGTVLESASGLSLAETAKFNYNVTSLEQKGQPYVVEYVCKDAEGVELDRGSETIYRYDRPTFLNADGVYIKDGQPFFPVMGYHIRTDNEEDYAYCNEAGINVIQYSPSSNEEELINGLDLLQQYDIMAFIVLYKDMKPAAHADNIENTKKIVEIVKDHPATFGYMVMDEPLHNGCSLEDLKNSYKVIRDIDPDRPVYMVEAPPQAEKYKQVGKCADILAVDPYPNGIYPVETFVSQHVRLAKEAVNYKKPVYNISQVFRRGINPTPDNVRHMNYQALFEGVEGIGYYDIWDAYGYNNGMKEHIWQRLCWDGIKYFAENETEDALKGFVLGEYPVLDEQRNPEVWWRVYEKEGLLYAVILNQTVNTIETDITLEGVGEFTAIEKDIAPGLPIAGNGVLSITLEPGECARYEITPEQPVNSYTITATAGSGGSISPAGSVSVAEGGSQTYSITPDQGYQISSVTVDGTSQGAISIYTFENVTDNHRINAEFTAISEEEPGNGEGDGDGTGNTGGSTPAAPEYKADISDLPPLSVTVDRAGKSGGVTIPQEVRDSISKGGTVTVSMPSVPDATSYFISLPVAYLSKGDGILILNTDFGSLALPSDMLTGIPGAEGKTARITIGEGGKEELSAEAKAAAGTRPLMDVSLTIDGIPLEWNKPGTPITVSMAYDSSRTELAAPESIVVWYIDGSGRPICVPNGHYDPITGRVTFKAAHFSLFGIGYHPVSFTDVAADAGYHKAVSFIAAREITSGTGNGRFSPEAKLNRSEFIVLMMKAYGIAPDTNPVDNFSDAGNTWYTGYLAAAKGLGISAGIGGNLFAPDKEVTRQEMFTLLHNALLTLKQLPQGDSGNSLSDFEDAELADAWANEALALWVKTGIISGSSGRLNPLGTATRAEMAQVLYNLLTK